MLNETSRFQLRESVGYRVMGASQFELACRLGWLNLVARDAETLEGIYAFYHPTFQEYFAALAVEDWHFFLNHIPENPQHLDARYRIFEKQWKEVILLWLGREEVGKEEKEAFIKALVKFKVGWDKFYRYQAYFLAAAGIAEFKDCSLADEIVSQIVIWGFGYFNEKKQEWRTFLDPITEGSREILKETDRERVIEALVESSRDSGNEETRWIAANILGQIDKYNPVAIEALVELIRVSQDENTRREAANSLEEIGKYSPVVISALVELIRTSQDEDTWRQAAKSLGEIGEDNPVAISALVELIRTSQDEDTWRQAAKSLGEIGEDNPVAISGLVELIRNSGDKNTRRIAASSLGQIDTDNSVILAFFEELSGIYSNEYMMMQLAYGLAKALKNNSITLAIFDNCDELIGTSEDDNTWRSAIDSLGKIDKNNSVAISALVDLIGTFQDKNTQRRAAVSLGKICKDNVVAIATLVDLIRNSDDNIARWQAADILGGIGKDNPVAIQALVDLICNSGDKNIRWRIANILEKIGKDNPVAIVSGLKDWLTSEISENDSNLYDNCYEVIWNCAQKMTYPDFYQAWHTQPTNSPIPNNHRQNTDIPTLLKQLQSTDKTCPVPLNIRALEGETDTSPIAQELCTQLYQTIFPADTDIPAIRNAPEFKRLIPQLKNRLQKQHIALILHSCPCEDALSSFTRKLADTHMGIHIAWITDTPLELPLTGFPVDGDDLLNAVHNWIEAIG
ncbi:HEAT repeat domain-containing protein [Microcoleus sp. LEGE 07076]|nr:HEAT repeat domain-containing protein [Microcoleus sp. LEGE 07076]